MVSPLGAAIEFLQDFGFFDIVLPFILVFTLVFALLDKTKILGKEGEEPKRNINTLVAFVFGLLVVATTSVVQVLNDALPVITLILIILLCFMLLVGAFHGDKEFDHFSSGFWKGFLTLVLFVAVILTFMNFVETDSGETWLEVFWNYVNDDFYSCP